MATGTPIAQLAQYRECPTARLVAIVKGNPTLRAQLSDFVPDAYAEACEDAFEEMGLLHWTFPAICPYTTEQLVDTEFWPMGDNLGNN